MRASWRPKLPDIRVAWTSHEASNRYALPGLFPKRDGWWLLLAPVHQKAIRPSSFQALLLIDSDKKSINSRKTCFGRNRNQLITFATLNRHCHTTQLSVI